MNMTELSTCLCVPSNMVATYQKSFDNLKKEQVKFETALESSMTDEQSEAWSQKMIAFRVSRLASMQI